MGDPHELGVWLMTPWALDLGRLSFPQVCTYMPLWAVEMVKPDVGVSTSFSIQCPGQEGLGPPGRLPLLHVVTSDEGQD